MKTNAVRGDADRTSHENWKMGVGDEWRPFYPTVLTGFEWGRSDGFYWANRTVKGPDPHSTHTHTAKEVVGLGNGSDQL